MIALNMIFQNLFFFKYFYNYKMLKYIYWSQNLLECEPYKVYKIYFSMIPPWSSYLYIGKRRFISLLVNLLFNFTYNIPVLGRLLSLVKHSKVDIALTKTS